MEAEVKWRIAAEPLAKASQGQVMKHGTDVLDHRTGEYRMAAEVVREREPDLCRRLALHAMKLIGSFDKFYLPDGE